MNDCKGITESDLVGLEEEFLADSLGAEASLEPLANGVIENRRNIATPCCEGSLNRATA